jgi:hypothetical protein
MTPTLTLSQAIARLEALKAQHGDVPIVLWDLDTSWYFPLEDRCFEAQLMDDDSVRISVGVEQGYGGDTMPEPAKRPL